MAAHREANAGGITLEQLIALNDEMAALVRAGVPLERGLAALGGDLPGRPGRLAELLASRMGAGESLWQILADEDRLFPPVWRAVVEAGLRSGHLAVALESLSATARRMADLRKLVGAGLLYPLIVVCVAYALFVFLAVWLAPVTLHAHEELVGSPDSLMAALAWLGRTAPWWAIPLPLAAAMVAGAWWRRSGRAQWSGSQRRLGSPSQGRPPRVSRSRLSHRRAAGIRHALRDNRMAAFAEVLALLVKEQVPLERSVVLAAEASGDRAIATASRQIAQRLQRGDVFTRREDLPRGFPPLLGWLLITDGRQPEWSKALLQTAAVYRQRAARTAMWTAIYLPIWLTVLIGGTATLACGLAVFVPIVRLLYHLTWP